MDEAEAHWVGHEDPDCPICQGRVSPEFIAYLEVLADDPISLEGDDFWAWLNDLIARDQ